VVGGKQSWTRSSEVKAKAIYFPLSSSVTPVIPFARQSIALTKKTAMISSTSLSLTVDASLQRLSHRERHSLNLEQKLNSEGRKERARLVYVYLGMQRIKSREGEAFHSSTSFKHSSNSCISALFSLTNEYEFPLARTTRSDSLSLSTRRARALSSSVFD